MLAVGLPMRLIRPARSRYGLAAAFFVVAAMAVGCSSSEPAGEPNGEPTTAPSPTSEITPPTQNVSPPDSTVEPTPLAELSPEELLDELFVWDGREVRVRVVPEAVNEALASGDERFLPPLVELTRWVLLFPERNAVEVALREMTGQDYEGFAFFNWYSWLGQNYEGEEFANYPAWKARLYNHIDPRFAQWFFNGVESEIPLWTAQWGGVRSDGIPPLDDPTMITAGEAIFMEPDEQVFGVFINGDARAYPLRFMNWHEMANDVVGGKPVTLAY